MTLVFLALSSVSIRRSEDEPRRIASNIAKLPTLLGQADEVGFGRRCPSTAWPLDVGERELSAVPRVEPLESERNFQRDADLMRELEVKTSRVRRGWIDRLKGYVRLYETKLTDGERAAYGRGPSREASEEAALRNWNAKFRDLDTREPE